MVRRVQLLADGFIQRGQQALTRGQSVYGDVLHAVRDPDIHYRWRAKLLAKISRDAAAGFDMVDPELADFIVGMRKGKPVRAQRVREAGRVKIQTQPVGFRPRHPVRKVFRFDFVTRDRLIGFEINGVQVQALWPGDQAQRQLQIRTQFGGVARFARIVTRGLNTPRQGTARVLETGDIITLPAVHGDGQTIELAQRLFDIHADGGETLFSQIPGLFKLSGHAQSSLVSRFC